MAGWEPFAFALFRGAVRAVPLDAATLEQALRALDAMRVVALPRATPLLKSATGVDAPPTSDEATLAKLQAAAQQAWRSLDPMSAKHLRNLLKLLAYEEDAGERTSLARDLGEKLTRAMLGHAPLKGALSEAVKQPGVGPIGPGMVLAGKFLLEELLGEGGYGQVFKALHQDLGKRVALKVLRPEVTDDEEAKLRFLREVEATTAFVHKYAVQLREFGRDRTRGCLYSTMDLIEGETIKNILETRGAMGPNRVLPLMVQTLEVLEEAHEVGLVHRDLKPSNLMVVQGRAGEEVRVLDFGIAKAASSAQSEEFGPLTLEGHVIGTLSYMSPEQAEGGALDGRSDLYSLGVVLFECLSNQLPVLASDGAVDSRRSFLTNLLMRPPRDLGQVAPQVPAPLRAAVMKALSKDPAQRFPSATAFRTELLAILRQLPTGDFQVATPAPPPPPLAPVDAGATLPPPSYEPTIRDLAATPASPGGAGYQPTYLDQVTPGTPGAAYQPTLRDAGPTAPEPAYQPTLPGPAAHAYQPTLRDAGPSTPAGPGPAYQPTAQDRAAPKPPKPPRSLFARLVMWSFASCFLVTLALGVSAIWWGPPAYRYLRKQLRDPAKVARAEELKRKADQLGKVYDQLPKPLGFEAPADLAGAESAFEAGEEAFERDDLLEASSSFERAAGRYREATRALAEAHRREAEAALGGWDALARGFSLRTPATLRRARQRLAEGSSLLRDDDARGAIEGFSDAVARYREAIREVDTQPPVLTLESPSDALATTQAQVKLAGTVRDMALEALLLNGQPVLTTPGKQPGVRRFALEVPLTALGERVLELRAKDAGGRETVVRRTVVRKPVVLEVTLTEPGKAQTKKAVRVVGAAKGAVPITGLTVNGAQVSLGAQGAFEHTITVEKEGPLTVEVVASGEFAEGKAKRVVYVDWTAPRIELGRAPKQVWEATVPVTLTVRDGAPQVEVRVAGGRTTQVVPGKATTIHLPCQEGKNAYRIVAVDPAGNESEPLALETVRKAGAQLLARYRTGPGRYRVTSTVQVAAGSRLVIPPGARLSFAQGIGLTCHGELLAPGSKGEPIVLEGDVGWTGISLIGAKAKGELQHTTIRGARKREGGGIFIERGASLTAQHLTLSKCQARSYGGGLYSNGQSKATPCRVKLSHVRFEDNHAQREGGGANFNSFTRASLEDCVFVRNRSSSYGAGLLAFGQASQFTEVVAARVRFDENEAKFAGGVLAGPGSKVTLRSCSFKENVATTGAGVYVLGSTATRTASATLVGCTLQGNRAKDAGGAARVHRFSTLVLRGGTIRKNSAIYGGGIDMLGSAASRAALQADGVRFEGNSAREGGGANVNAYSQAVFEKCSFSGNSATGQGGGLIAIGKKRSAVGPLTDLDLRTCTFAKNISPRGPDLRVAANATFRREQLKACGLTDPGRYDIDPSVRAPTSTAPKTNVLGLIRQPATPFAKKLLALIARGLKNDFRDLHKRFAFKTSSGSRCYQTAFTLPGARMVQLWIRKDGTQYANIQLEEDVLPGRGTSEYRRYMGVLERALAKQWKKKEQAARGKFGGRTCSFSITRGKQQFVLRLELYMLEEGGRKLANVSLFVN